MRQVLRLLRGALRRGRGAQPIPPADLMRENSRLAARAASEIVLLGQTVNAYISRGVGFRQLLRMVAAVEGIERIRFLPHRSESTCRIR